MEQLLFDRLWMTICAILVLLMQAGFLCLEAGSTRRKNSINAAMKNITDFAVAVLIFWLVGFGVGFGGSGNGWWTGWGQWPDASGTDAIVFFLFQAMFCGTAVTIVSGAVAERMRFRSYVVLSAIVSGAIYPVFVHWSWNSIGGSETLGWLQHLGFLDFAGSTVVHSLGGWVSLAAVLFIGPRDGRFSQDGRTHDFYESDTTRSILGCLILWFGWLGFNGGSTLTFNDSVPLILLNTILGGAGGLLVPLTLGWLRGGAVRAAWMVNGCLAGLVSVTAACNILTPSASILVGALGGVVMLSIDRLLRQWKIDDAVGAIPVHLGGGIWGTLCVALFARTDAASPIVQLGVQSLGIAACGIWSMAMTFATLALLRRFGTLRVSRQDERVGLNVAEHGARSDLNELLAVMADHRQAKNLDRRAPAEPFSEFGQIAECYNQTISALQDATSRTQAIVDTALEAIFTADFRTLTIASANPAAAQMFGWQDDRPDAVVELFSASVFESVRSRLPDGPEAELTRAKREEFLRESFEILSANRRAIEIGGQRVNGETFPMEICASVVPSSSGPLLIVSANDISRRKQDETRLRRAAAETSKKNVQLQEALTALYNTQTRLINSEKIAALGRMVGGVAHEINNPIGFIYGNLHHIQEYVGDLWSAIDLYNSRLPEPDDDLAENLEDLELDFIRQDLPELLLSMRTGAERIRLIVESLRVFARLDEAELKRIDINDSIDSALLLLDHSCSGQGIEVVRRYGDLPPVECFSAHLNQVFFNILVNAIDALESARDTQPQPRIEIVSEHADDEVSISIGDNGPGMSSTELERACEPFYTTKGTGLGLAIGYQIVVDEHKGRFELESEPGERTAVTIAIPTRRPNVASFDLNTSAS